MGIVMRKRRKQTVYKQSKYTLGSETIQDMTFPRNTSVNNFTLGCNRNYCYQKQLKITFITFTGKPDQTETFTNIVGYESAFTEEKTQHQISKRRNEVLYTILYRRAAA